MDGPPPPPRPQSVYETYGDWVSKNATKKLWPHQLSALQNISKALKDSEEPVILRMPTGTGKTGVITVLPYWLAGKNIVKDLKTVLIISPNKQVSTQLANDIRPKKIEESFLVKVGIIPKDHPQRDYNVFSVLPQLTSHEKLRARTVSSAAVIVNAQKFGIPKGQWVPEWRQVDPKLVDLVIVDEAHHVPASYWTNIIDHLRSVPTVFLTATPIRHTGAKLSKSAEYHGHRKMHVFKKESVVLNWTKNQAVEGEIIRSVHSKVLCWDLEASEIFNKFKGKFPIAASENFNLATFKAHYSVLVGISDLLKKRNLETPLPGGKTHQSLILVNGCEIATALALLASILGINAASYTSRLGKRDKRRVMASFKNGSISILFVVGLLTEGFDHPPISVVGILRNLKSPILFNQFVGRAVRRVRFSGSTEAVMPAFVCSHADYEQQKNLDDYITDVFVHDGTEVIITTPEGEKLDFKTFVSAHVRDEIQDTELELVKKRLKTLGLKMVDVTGDGNCQFRAIAVQIPSLDHKILRTMAVSHIRKNPGRFKAFIDDTGLLGGWDSYLLKMGKDKEWGDFVTLQAIADLFQIRIQVVTSTRDGTDSSMYLYPTGGDSLGHIYIGKIGYWHFVGTEEA